MTTIGDGTNDFFETSLIMIMTILLGFEMWRKSGSNLAGLVPFTLAINIDTAPELQLENYEKKTKQKLTYCTDRFFIHHRS